MDREKGTIKKMLGIYCRAHHNNPQGLCSECSQLKEYAFLKLNNCPFGRKKPVCSKCRVHCYGQEQRVKIIKVMRFSGPRMVYKHPIFALKHAIRSFVKL
jgi:Nitrous oxide-stimulated promoter